MRRLGIIIFLSLGVLPIGAQGPSAAPQPLEAEPQLIAPQHINEATKPALTDTKLLPEKPSSPLKENPLLGAGFQDLPKIPENIRVTNDGVLEFDSKTGNYLFKGKVVIKGDNGITLKARRVLVNSKEETATLTGDVAMRQTPTKDNTGRIIPGIQLFANHVLLNAKTKIVTLTGNVSIYQGPTLHRGDRAEYNYGTGQLVTHDLASGLGSILLESDRFRMIERHGKKAFIGDNAGITTHDVAHPNYWLRADRTTIYPNDRIIFKNLRLYAGDTPIFWLPYLSQPLNEDLGYHFIPGARSNWGFYLLNTYGIMLGGDLDEETGEREGAWLLSQWHLDIRSRRGVGLGMDLIDTRLKDNQNLGWLKTYYLNDWNPSLSRSSEIRGFVNEDRWKFELKHRIDLVKQGDNTTYLDFEITALSDRYFLEDFEPGTFRIDPNPDNEIGIYHRSPQYLLGLYSRLRLNDFYQTDTRLPELFFDQIKGPILNSPILHEGQTTFGIYEEQLADFEQRNLRAKAALLPPGDPRLPEINKLLAERAYTRFHTWHEFSLPLNPGGKIAITPRVGAGYTRYWALGGATQSFDRTHISAGIDTSLKFSRLYPNIMNHSWGVDGLLHIFQPYANFSILSTNSLDPSFEGIETLTPSTRPRPLEVGRFTATDDLADWSIIRLGARNRLLTKRDGDTHEWLTMNTYIDLFMNDPEFDRSVSNLYNDIIWKPLPWMKLNLETQFPIIASGSGFREISTHATIMPTDNFEFTLGYRLLSNHPILRDSNLVTLRTYSRINESWGLSSYHRWEFDDNTLEVQQYAVYHDFDSWTASLGFQIREHRNNKSEYGVMLNFTLKEFPQVNLPLSIDRE